MSSAGDDDLRLFVGQRAAGALVPGKGWAWFNDEVRQAGLTACIKAARAIVGPRPGLRVWLSGSLARPFVVPATAGLQGREESELLARALAAREIRGQMDQTVLWLDDLPGSEPVLAVVADGKTVSDVIDAASACRVGLRSVRPWWADQVKARSIDLQGSAALVIEDPEALVFLAFAEGQWASAGTTSPRAGGDAESAWVQRRTVDSGLSSSDVVQLRWHERLPLEPLGSDSGEGEAPSPPFANLLPRARPRLWHWVLPGVLVALALGGFTYAAWADQEALQALKRQTFMAAPITPTKATSRPHDPEGARELLKQRAAAWPAALASLEGSRVEGVRVSAVDIDTQANLVRVEVEAPGHIELAKFTQQASTPEGGSVVWDLLRASRADEGAGVKGVLQGRRR